MSFRFWCLAPVVWACLLICAPLQARAGQPEEPAASVDAAAQSADGVAVEFDDESITEIKYDAAGNPIAETGVASFYGAAHQGKRTATGTRFNQMAMTAAHPWLPFGTKVLVTVERTGRAVVVTITDRLPSGRRVIDVSLGAARALGFVGQGLAHVSLVSLAH